MSEQVDYNQLYDQLLLSFQIPFLKIFPFYVDFQNRWETILSKNIRDPIFIYTKGEGNEEAQFYKQPMFLNSGFKYELRYNIFLIQSFYRKELRRGASLFFKPCVLKQKDKELMLDNTACDYNQYPVCECCKTAIDTPPFISYLPILPKQYVVIDGNHRISYFVAQNKEKIAASLIIPDCTSIFLGSSAEACTFLFLKDICSLGEKVKHSDVSTKGLVIYRYPSIISALKRQGRLR